MMTAHGTQETRFFFRTLISGKYACVSRLEFCESEYFETYKTRTHPCRTEFEVRSILGQQFQGRELELR
jgi:hypothetical protein